MTIQLDPFQKVLYLPARYTITPDFVTRNEGQDVIFTVTVYNVATGTVLNAKLEGVSGTINDADFTSPTSPVSGTPIQITVDASIHTYTFTVSIKSDFKTEGTESFRAYLLNGTTRVATSNTVTILDTSIAKVAAGPTSGTWTNVLGATDVRWADNGMVAWSHRNQDTSYTAGADDYSVSIFTRSGGTLTLVKKLGVGASYSTSCDFNSTGTLFAHTQAGGLTSSRGIRVFSRSGNTFTQVFSNNTSYSFTTPQSGHIRFNPQGTRLAVITSTTLLIYSVSGTTITLLYNNSTYSQGSTLAWNPAGTRLAIGFNNTNFYRIYNAVTNTYIALLNDGITHVSNNTVNNISYSPDGSLLVAAVSGSYDSTPSQVGLVHWTVSGDTYTLQTRIAETGLYTNTPAGTGLRNGAFYEAESLSFKPDGSKVIIGLEQPNTLDPNSTSGQDTSIAIGMWARSGGSLTWDKSYGGIGGIYGANGDEPVGNGSPLLKLPRRAFGLAWNPAGTSVAVAVYNNPPYFRIYDLS